MAVQTIAELRAKFEKGDRPTASDFIDLIDSFLHSGLGNFPNPLPAVSAKFLTNVGDVLPDPLPKRDGSLLFNIALEEFSAPTSVSPTYETTTTFVLLGNHTGVFLKNRNLRITLAGVFFYTSVSNAMYDGVFTRVTTATPMTNSQLTAVSVATLARFVPTVAALRAFPVPTAPVVAYVHGYSADGDGGGGQFLWNSADTTADDGGKIIAPSAGGTGRWNRVHDGAMSVKWFGAVGDNVTDDRAAFANADTAAGPGKILLLPPGTYRIASSITLASSVFFMEGAKLSIATGATVTFSAIPRLPKMEVFTWAGTGVVVLPRTQTEYNAVWWGANTTRTDNQVSINAAIVCVDTSAGFNGGVVDLPSGTFKTSAQITFKNRVVLRGSNARDTEIMADSATWVGDTMARFENGAFAMFNSRAENIHFRASSVAAITRVIHASAWNEQCGLRHCLVTEFVGQGIRSDTGTGGSASFELDNIEVQGAVGSTYGIWVGNGFAVGYSNVLMRHVTVVGPSGSTITSAIYAEGRTIVNLQGVHVENCTNGVELQQAAILVGDGLTGSPTNVTNLIRRGGTHVGKLCIAGARRAGAAVLLRDDATGFTQLAGDQISDPLVWPPDQRLVGDLHKAVAASTVMQNRVMAASRSLTDAVTTDILQVTLTAAASKDDGVAIHIKYYCVIPSGTAMSVESGQLTWVVSQDGGQVRIHTLSPKFGNAQNKHVDVTAWSVTFASALVGNVVTLTCNQDNSLNVAATLFVEAHVTGIVRPVDTTVAFAAGMVKAV